MRHNAEWFVNRDAACGLARWNGKVNPTALAKLCAEMGVKLPVKVKGSAGITRMGTHRLRVNEQATLRAFREGADKSVQEHRITVSSYACVYQANSTLRHELMHAVQVERAMDEGRTPKDESKEYTRLNRAYGYKRNPREVEAREASTKYTTDAITQTPVLTERQHDSARAHFPAAWFGNLRSHMRREAEQSVIPPIREHYQALLAAEHVDLGGLFDDEGVEIGQITDITIDMTNIVESRSEPVNTPTEREAVEAKLRAWRDERGMSQPTSGEWNAMVERQLAKTRTNVQSA